MMADKNENYYSNIRLDLLNLISKQEKLKVLEIGAGYGQTLAYLKESGRSIKVVGVELSFQPEKKNLYDKVDQFIFGDIEKLSLTAFDGYFDLIILADVLEHLQDPLAVLKKLKPTLAKNGQIIASIPNIRSLEAFYNIFVRGTFPQKDQGLFDSTHVNFYCKKDMLNLFNKAGFKVELAHSALKYYKKRSFKKFLNKVSFGIFEEFLSTQYFIRATHE